MRMRESVGLAAVALCFAACSSGDGGGPPTGGGPTTGTLSGQVIDVDSSNGGVSGVVVQVTGPAGGQNATTAANGSWSVPNAAPGSWQAAVQVPGTLLLNAGETGTRSVTVTAGQTTNVQAFSLARPKGTISGSATYGGTGIAGGTVVANRAGFTARNTAPTAAGFTLANVPVGNWNLTYTPPATYVRIQGESGTRAVAVTAGGTTTPSAFEVEPAPLLVVIQVSGTSFTPNDVTISPGTTVRWVNGDGVMHTVTPQNAGQAGAWSRQELNTQDAQFEHMFNAAGQEYRFRCEPHSADFQTGMVGIIRVTN